MATTNIKTCHICEALCSLEITHEQGEILQIRGNKNDPLSQGFICPKGVAIQDLHTDPNRIREPLQRTKGGWRPIAWDDAFNEAAENLTRIRERDGRRALGLYLGNPNVHNITAAAAIPTFQRALGAKSKFSATSVDQLPHMFAAFHMFGHQLMIPIPDIDRSDFIVIMGANPAASNGSLMTAPNYMKRLSRLQDRGGKAVVVDPRMTETAKKASQHIPIRPGTDALLLAAWVHELLSDDRALQKLPDWVDLPHQLIQKFEAYTPERVAKRTGVPAEVQRNLFREFKEAKRSVLYTRIGVCTQEFGGLAAWLANVVNILSGRLDEPGGVMFTSPAIDILKFLPPGHFDGWRSRVRDLPEFGGELPVVTLAEEIDTPGEGQVKGLVTIAGNPMLSTPNHQRLGTALESLEYMVSVDIYQNETTKYANLILPSASPLERPHYGIVFHALAVRNTVKYDPGLFPLPPGAKTEWDILLELGERLYKQRNGFKYKAQALSMKAMRLAGVERVLDLGLRTGPYGFGKGHASGGLSIKKLKENPNGFDLGHLTSKLPTALNTPNKSVILAPDICLADLPRLEASLDTEIPPLVLIGRRHLRSNNSWLHNSKRLSGGSRRCTAMIHPEDAASRSIQDGDICKVASRVGEVEVPAEITDTIMAGTISIPHGWGHHQSDIALDVASEMPGVSVNVLTDDTFFDHLTGNAGLNGVPVTLSKV